MGAITLANLRQPLTGRPPGDYFDPAILREIGNLRMELEAAGEPPEGVLAEAKRSSVSALLTALDLVGRPGFAVAGATERLVAGKGIVDAGQAAVTELFSGLFGLKGKKPAFGGILEKMGVPRGGYLSDLLPFLYNKEGTGAFQWERHGFFDFTPRGALGLTLDIATDPVAYYSFGAGATARNAAKAGEYWLSKKFGVPALRKEFQANVKRLGAGVEDVVQMDELLGPQLSSPLEVADSMARETIAARIAAGESHLADQGGIKFFGRTLVPGATLSRHATSVKDGVIKVLEGTSLGDSAIRVGDAVYEGTGVLFQNLFRAREFPKFVSMTRNLVDRRRYLHKYVRQEVDRIGYGLTIKEREAITFAIDAGTTDALPSKLKVVTDDIIRKQALMGGREIEADLLDHLRMNYILHAFKEAPREVKKLLSGVTHPGALRANLKGSEKERIIKETLEKLKASGKLHPITDALELLRRRWYRHVDAIETDKYLREVKAKFGFLPETVDLGKGEVIDGARLSTVQRLIEKGKTPLDDVRKLSEAERGEFFRQRFERSHSLRENEDIINKYKEFESSFPEAPSDFVRSLPMPDGAEVVGIPQLEGVKLPRGIAEEITDFWSHFVQPREVNRLLRAYDLTTNVFKRAVTSIWPAFHFRNHYSNVGLTFTDLGLTALNLKMHGDAVRVLAGMRGSFQTKLGREVSYDRLRYEAAQRGVLMDPADILETTGDVVPIATTKTQKLFELLKSPLKAAGHVTAFVDNTSRMALFTNYVRRGASFEESAARMKKFLFDYTNVSKAEREVFARTIPFYRWIRKNLTLQVERLARNPRQAVIQGALFRKAAADPSAIPTFLRGEAVIQLDTDDDGTITTVRGIDLPISDLNTFFNQGLHATLYDAASRIAPLPKLIMELAMDKQFFTQQPISQSSRVYGLGKFFDEDVRAVPGGEAVLKWLGLNVRVVDRRGQKEYFFDNPTSAYILLKSYAAARAYRTADRLFDAIDQGTMGTFMLDVSTGLRLNDVTALARLRTIKEEERDILAARALQIGIRRPVPEKTFRPKGTGAAR